MNVLCISGPPDSGKDTVANMIACYLTMTHNKRVVVANFAEPLEKMLATMLGVNPESMMFNMLRNGYKDQPVSSQMAGITGTATPRQLMIAVSETVIRPWLDPGWLGKLAAHKHWEVIGQDGYLIISSCGFQIEYDAFKQVLESLNCGAKLGVLQVSRPTKSFVNDSRELISDHPNTHYLKNNRNLMQLKKQVGQFVDSEML